MAEQKNNEIQLNDIDYIKTVYETIDVTTYHNFDHTDESIHISHRILFLALKSIYHINNNTIETFLEENLMTTTLKYCYSFIKSVMYDIIGQKITAFNNLVDYMLYNDNIEFAKYYFWYLSIFVKQFENRYNIEENENSDIKDFVMTYAITLLENPEDILILLELMQSEKKRNALLEKEYISLSNDLTKLYNEEN